MGEAGSNPYPPSLPIPKANDSPADRLTVAGAGHKIQRKRGNEQKWKVPGEIDMPDDINAGVYWWVNFID